MSWASMYNVLTLNDKRRNMNARQPTPMDRNFDDIVDHFEKKIYGKRKGRIRLAVLWRDIQSYLDSLPECKCLSVLDVGGGFGQIAQRLAKLGHRVTVNDISANMLAKAQALATEQGIEAIDFIHAPYQVLPDVLDNQTYDLVLCHAVLEWLAEPQAAIPVLKSLLADSGTLSLCFYNPVAKVYRNLIMGNFYNLDNVANNTFQSDSGSLTPNNPSHVDDVKSWLVDANMNIMQETGIRVFSDYVPAMLAKRGGHENLDAVIEKELEYSTQTPYKYMGRYFHILANTP